MKANRSISMTLLVLMLVSSWSVPADAGLLDRLCRIGRARTTVCRPVQRQRLLGRVFHLSRGKSCNGYQEPPGGGLRYYCPQRIFEVRDGANTVFCVYKMQICGDDAFFLTNMTCNTQSGSCGQEGCSTWLSLGNIQPRLIFVDPLHPSILTDFKGADHLGYRPSVGSISYEINNPSLENIAKDYTIVTETVRVRYQGNNRTFLLLKVTGPDSQKTGFGLEIIDDKALDISTDYKIYEYTVGLRFGPLQFQQEPKVTLPEGPPSDRWLLMVYPKSGL